MLLYEALYGRKCQSLLCWYELREHNLLGPELIRQTTEQIKKICSKILTAQSHQKSYIDVRRRLLEFQKGDHVFLKITPTTRIGRANKVKKLSPRSINPFQILRPIGSVTYRVALPPHLSNLYDVFYVSQLRKYNLDFTHFLEPESIQLRDDLTFHVALARLVDKSIKQRRNKTVPLVKVAWGGEGTEDHTLELKSDMQKEYPELFSDTKF